MHYTCSRHDDGLSCQPLTRETTTHSLIFRLSQDPDVVRCPGFLRHLVSQNSLLLVVSCWPVTLTHCLLKPKSHIHVRGYGPRGLITDREVTDETCCSSPVVAGKHVPMVRVRKTRAVGGFETVSWRQDQGNSGLYHGPP